MINPLRDEMDWITLAGVKSPGKAIVSGGRRSTGWEEQKGAATSGATLKYNGQGLAEFDVEIQLWEDSHFLAWDSFRALLKPAPKDPSAPVVALDLRHPFVDELEANSVVLTERTMMEESGDTGLYTVGLKFKEYRKAEPVAGVARVGGTALTEAEATKKVTAFVAQTVPEMGTIAGKFLASHAEKESSFWSDMEQAR